VLRFASEWFSRFFLPISMGFTKQKLIAILMIMMLCYLYPFTHIHKVKINLKCYRENKILENINGNSRSNLLNKSINGWTRK
jgi:hypothetical protein